MEWSFQQGHGWVDCITYKELHSSAGQRSMQLHTLCSPASAAAESDDQSGLQPLAWTGLLYFLSCLSHVVLASNDSQAP